MKRTPHPDGDGLRRIMRTELSNLGEYRRLLDAFSRAVKEAESIQCN